MSTGKKKCILLKKQHIYFYNYIIILLFKSLDNKRDLIFRTKNVTFSLNKNNIESAGVKVQN